METVLYDCESQLNSRPLTYVSDDPDDLYSLTPDMFLKDIHNSVTANLDKISLAEKKERFIYRKRLTSDLRIRLRNECLSQLHQRSTVRNQVYNPKIGEIALLWNENLKRIHWPLGRILRKKSINYHPSPNWWTQNLENKKNMLRALRRTASSKERTSRFQIESKENTLYKKI
ncbi:hypothetical protein AVEN_36290-1 [Araneus ventricosus]|uniref:DUF5641 domain-containing protein n=1 Tax=Araneus ventricosus TaxID=182803 RepID=A0A4Y2QG08_ARAVE|nr:hypothetical protein AVEN_106060-1 [Araneus ventricosus]GBN62432.1 hypothetical protein AVEN_36290-1 [Araneus ventricosus]